MKLRTPRGVKDFLPADAEWKFQLEQQIRAIFGWWGYQEVITPTFEFHDVLAQGGPAAERHTYRFFDNNGELLVLRSDLTMPIARMVATRFKHELKPLRFSYIANVFRYDDVQVGFQREFYQAGVELIGTSSAAADAEVAALAISVFNDLGVRDFSLDIGHADFIHGVLEECTNSTVRQQIWDLLLRRDLVGLRNLVTASDLTSATKELLLDLPHCRGKEALLEEVYQRTVNPHARQALINLREIFQYIQAYGYGDQVTIDLSIVKSLGYYTGMVLEGYVPSLGFTICSGGRYDHLSCQFGNDLPAVGFALGLERLMLVLEQQGLRPERKPQGLLVLPVSWEHALAYAMEQRKAGIRVEVDTEGRSEAEAVEYARKKNYNAVVIIEKQAIRSIALV